jgi:polysaccharide pyruvyl transferase WcaK-like protein
VGQLVGKVPAINIAAGSCYPWEQQPEHFINPAEAKYAEDIGRFCKLTTTRDKLASRLFESVGVNNILLPCTAFFVNKDFENPEQGKYILINYMSGAGHFDWGQHIDGDSWEKTMIHVISELKSEHEIKFICHNKKEEELAKRLMPDASVYFPRTVQEYLECIRHAKLGINNRMHASVAMASMGIPAISVCTDTRLLMLENIELPIFYAKDINAEGLLKTARTFLNNLAYERERLFTLKKNSFFDYQKLLKEFVGKR